MKGQRSIGAVSPTPACGPAEPSIHLKYMFLLSKGMAFDRGPNRTQPGDNPTDDLTLTGRDEKREILCITRNPRGGSVWHPHLVQ